MNKLTKISANFLNGLLKLEPKERITAKESLYHPYFDGLRNDEEEQATIEFRSSSHLRRQDS